MRLTEQQLTQVISAVVLSNIGVLMEELIDELADDAKLCCEVDCLRRAMKEITKAGVLMRYSLRDILPETEPQ
jgi:hypothetical protein